MKLENASQEGATQDTTQGLSSQELKKLVHRAQSGNEEAFCDLYQRFSSLILFHVSERINHPEDVEDVAQEVVVQMWRGIEKLQSPHAFYNWMLRIIINTCANYSNRAGKKKDLEYNGYDDDVFGDLMDTDVSEQDAFSSNEFGPEEQDWLYAQITQLPMAQRESITLHYLDNLSYQEIADLLGVTIGTISSNISKAKRTLLAQREKERLESVSQEGLDLAFALPLALQRQVAHVAASALRARFIKATDQKLKTLPRMIGKGVFTSKFVGVFGASLAALLAVSAVVNFIPAKKSVVDKPASISVTPATATPSSKPQGVINIEWGVAASTTSPHSVSRETSSVSGPSAGSRPTAISVQLFSSKEQATTWELTATSGSVAIEGAGRSVDPGTLASLVPGSYRITWVLKNTEGVSTQLSRTFRF